MCFGNRKKKPEDSSKKGSKIVKKEDGKSSVNKSRKSRSKSRSKVEPDVGLKNSASKSRASRVSKEQVSKSMGKSSFEQGKSKVTVEQIRKPSEQIFANYKMDQVMIAVNVNQHKAYVRKEDYFDESVDFQVQANPADVNLATYQIASGLEIATPPVNKFLYDHKSTKVE